MAEPKIRKPFGLWESPVTPELLARFGRFGEVRWGPSGEVIWQETRSGQGGIRFRPASDEPPDDLPGAQAVRARVGYGGGDFTVGGGKVYFVDANTGQIFRQSLHEAAAHPVTPEFGSAASPSLSPDGSYLLFVHSYAGEDNIGVVDAAATRWPQKLVAGDDFYMQPSWHPHGDRIAWVAWNHPNMPWNGAVLRIGHVRSQPGALPALGDIVDVAGGEAVSVLQPEFSPDGRSLAYISDSTGRWQIYLYDLQSRRHRRLTSTAADYGVPAWVQGLRLYQFSGDGSSIYAIRNQSGYATLCRIELVSAAEEEIPLDPEYTWLDQVAVASDEKRIALIASGARTPPRVITWHREGQGFIVAQSEADTLPPEAFSAPKPITWSGMDGDRVHGLYYRPHNQRFKGIGNAPLVVSIHGGPTGQARVEFNPQVQFLTSRGFAVLEVNHRGSTGFGRDYWERMNGQWGVVDVQDAVSGARHLADAGEVDGQRTAIIGRSAGGFTVLRALIDFPGTFRAGICVYGVVDLFTLAEESHKFERGYLDRLIGPLPAAAAVYQQRSPLFQAAKIRDPVAVFQGAEDRIVRRDQSDSIVEALQQRGVPHEYHVYTGEGHGFRNVETIIAYYEAVERFLRRYVLS